MKPTPLNKNNDVNHAPHSDRQPFVTFTLKLNPEDTQRLFNLCGVLDANILLLEKIFQTTIKNNGWQFIITGTPIQAKQTIQCIEKLYDQYSIEPILTEDIHYLSQSFIKKADNRLTSSNKAKNKIAPMKIATFQKTVETCSINQHHYVASILEHDIQFAIGPAGSGKTYLAVACAVNSLFKQEVDRIILTRPAIEAGEKLGFLPGDMSQKVDPYLRPLYDALYTMIGAEKVQRLIEQNIIEIAPLAYMRGRTLSRAFVILDEAQNSTKEQLKMFLTRIGFESKAVITGDITQIDLPKANQSGLRHAIKILRPIEGIGFSFLEKQDIVRHELVKQIVKAYEDDEQPQHGNGEQV